MNRAHRYWIVLLACSLLLVVSMADAASAPAAQLTGALHWRSVGPYMGGRVTTVAGVPGEPNRFYAGYAGGGIWETTDYGQHWHNISDKYFSPTTSGTVGAMAVAPSNPKIIYVGTGDSAPRNTVLTGHGMYKSTDAGKTWKEIGLGDTHIITWILVDPKNPDVAYVGALGHLFAPNQDRGVFKTTDGGKTWKKILYVDADTGVATMAMDPKDPDVLYVAMWQMQRSPWDFSSGGPSSGIWKSTDGGAHWNNISHNQGLPAGVLGKVGLAVAPSNPNVVYALVQAHVTDSEPGGLYRSEDAGKTWKLMNTSMEVTQRAFYYMRVYVDPRDANTLWLPNVELLVSRDGGKTIKKVSTPHGDNHALWINPENPEIMIEGNDGGATVTLNGGRSWSSEMNQPTGQFYHANLDDQFPFHIYGAQQDRGSVEGPSAARGSAIPPVWKNVIGGEIGWVVPTPGQPWVSYGTGYYGLNFKENRRIAVLTNVTPYPGYKFGHKGASIKYRFGWTFHPIAFAHGNPKMLLVGANVVFKTLDEGIHWSVISPDLTRNDKSKQQRPGGPISADVTGEEMYDTISAIAISPFSDDTIWVGTDDGLVQLTTDGGKTWSEVRPPDMPTWAIVSSIEASPTDRGTAYVTASRYMWDDFHPYVYKTTDFGKHWTQITNGLPDDEYVMSVRQDPVNANLLFAGTSASVYMSLDGGAHWQSLALNLPAVVVNDIQIQPEQHAVVLATFGRAFWVMDNLQFLEQLGDAHVDKNAPYLFKPQQAWLVKRSAGGSGAAQIGGTNLPAGATVFFHLPADYNGKTPVKLDIEDATGKLVNSYTLPVKPEPKQDKVEDAFAKPKKAPAKLHPGMNSFHWNLRYPDAQDVKGIYHSYFAAAKPAGPEVVPGKYYAVLHYGRTTLKQPFEIKLDPRLDTTQAGLQARFDLLMRLRDAVNDLSTHLNQAIDTRDALNKALEKKSVDGDAANKAVATLDHDIGSMVNLKIQSGEGALVYAPQLRAWLSAITNQVDFAFVKPTPSMVEVADGYIAESENAVKRLQADTAVAKAVLKH